MLVRRPVDDGVDRLDMEALQDVEWTGTNRRELNMTFGCDRTRHSRTLCDSETTLFQADRATTPVRVVMWLLDRWTGPHGFVWW
jgi:hypothetical protein